MNIETLKAAKDKLAIFRLNKKDNPLMESIDIQLDYLMHILDNSISDKTRLKDITIGIIAVREIEGIDDDLAELLYEIDAWVDDDLVKE